MQYLRLLVFALMWQFIKAKDGTQDEIEAIDGLILALQQLRESIPLPHEIHGCRQHSSASTLIEQLKAEVNQ